MGLPARAVTNSQGYTLLDEVDIHNLRGGTPSSERMVDVWKRELKLDESRPNRLKSLLNDTKFSMLASHILDEGNDLFSYWDCCSAAGIIEMTDHKSRYRATGSTIFYKRA